MQELARARAPDRGRLLLCGFGPCPDAPDNAAVQAVRRLIETRWSPRDGEVQAMVAPVLWNDSVEAVMGAVADLRPRGLLLVAHDAQERDFAVQMRAANRVSRRRRDASGALFGRDRIAATGPGVARVTAPVMTMVRAIETLSLPARASSDLGDGIGNYVLYRLLTEASDTPGAPDAGALVAPGRLGDGGPTPPEAVLSAVCAAATAFARALIPAPAYV
jgi:pyrrolidone-carboxylate peptidase